jgi:hypothetical protein
MSIEREIAIVIGHHFWKCESDDRAALWGADCAREVMRRINDMHDAGDLRMYPQAKLMADGLLRVYKALEKHNESL